MGGRERRGSASGEEELKLHKTREGRTLPANQRTEGHEGSREKLEVNLSR